MDWSERKVRKKIRGKYRGRLGSHTPWHLPQAIEYCSIGTLESLARKQSRYPPNLGVLQGENATAMMLSSGLVEDTWTVSCLCRRKMPA